MKRPRRASARPAVLRLVLRVAYYLRPTRPMPEHEFPLILVTRLLDADVRVGEELLVPEVLAVHANPVRLHDKLRALAETVLEGDGPAKVYRRIAGVDPQVSRLVVALE